MSIYYRTCGDESMEPSVCRERVASRFAVAEKKAAQVSNTRTAENANASRVSTIIL